MADLKIVHAMHALDKTKHDGAPCGEKGLRQFSPYWAKVTCEGCLSTLAHPSGPSKAFETFARIGMALDDLAGPKAQP